MTSKMAPPSPRTSSIRQRQSGISRKESPIQLVIFTDLDGTLLDEADYAFADAVPTLARIARQGIPLILTTSKTRAEVEPLRRMLGIEAPFIVENGGGICFPAGEKGLSLAPGAMLPLGIPYARIRTFIRTLPATLPLRGFGDLTDDEVAALTDLPRAQAALARQREFTEPFLIEDASLLPLLESRARTEGLQVIRGGRFYHLIGAGQDKGAAVRRLREILAAGAGPHCAIGLGDGENDLPLLDAVDIPVLIPRADERLSDLVLPGLIRAPEPGARGWSRIVVQLLDAHPPSGGDRCGTPAPSCPIP